MWTFDVPTGTWRDADLSRDILNRAMQVAGLNELRQVYTGRGGWSRDRRPEYGRAYVLPVDDRDLVPLVDCLAACLRKVEAWALLPELRRSDESVWVCECGQEFRPPTDFGREDPFGTHRREFFPPHKGVFTPRPGGTVAFYGVGSGPTPGVEPLVEGGPIPTEAA